MTRGRAALVWAALGLALAVPMGVAMTSPLLAWRDPVYIAAGLAGVAGLGLCLVQPLLAGGWLPGLTPRRARRLHVWVGAGLAGCVLAHVGLLWVTSPPDVVDALLLRSPTPFSIWGVAALWAVLAAALLARLRRRLHPVTWRRCHGGLAAVIVLGTVIHALLIDGTMGPGSKAVLCALVLAAALPTLARAWPRRRPGAGQGGDAQPPGPGGGSRAANSAR